MGIFLIKDDYAIVKLFMLIMSDFMLTGVTEKRYLMSVIQFE